MRSVVYRHDAGQVLSGFLRALRCSCGALSMRPEMTYCRAILGRMSITTMRHKNAETLLRIALDMQGSYAGLSLQDIAENYSDAPLSRRTAERLRDAVIALFDGKVEEHIGESRIKRWRLRSGLTRRLFRVEPGVLSALEMGRKFLLDAGLSEQAAHLSRTAGALSSQMDQGAWDLEDALELQSVAEGIAVRPGPRVKFDPGVMADLQEALRRRRVIEIKYRSPEGDGTSVYTVHPYGLLYGHRHYLVGATDPGGSPKYFVLGRIESTQLRPHTSIIRAGFDLKAHAERSFGIWQEEPQRVHWRFKPEVARRAAEYQFHPTQATEWAEDGSLHVRFEAGGILEMDWHLYTWGDGVEVIEPKALKRARNGMRGAP